MTTKHTPATWSAGTSIICGTEFFTVCEVQNVKKVIAITGKCKEGDEGESIANAKIIEQAPIMFEENKRLKASNAELLDALVKVVENLSEIVKASDGVEVEGIDLYEACESLKKACSVIERATT